MRVSPACVAMTMDGALAMQDGLRENGSGTGTFVHPDALPEPLGSLAPPDQRDEAQCKSLATLCAAALLTLCL